MVKKTNKAIFLDRDGILNNVVVDKKKNKILPPYNKNEFRLLYENIKSINQFKEKYLFFIITNQPDIKKGNQSEDFNNYINSRIKKLINIKEIATCLCLEHEKDCNCYKPKPKMINDLKKKWKIDIEKSFVIGDRWRDIGAGKQAGCQTIFLKKEYNILDLTRIKPDYTVSTLKILKQIIPN